MIKTTVLTLVLVLAGACSSEGRATGTTSWEERREQQLAEARERDLAIKEQQDSATDRDGDGTVEASESEAAAAASVDDTTPVEPGVANADNTGRNAFDNEGSVTPVDQSNSDNDLKITQQIRKNVMNEKLSFDAKNVKIVTMGGKVTLRGPVNTPEEKSTIESCAREVVGVTNVINQLEVKR